MSVPFRVQAVHDLFKQPQTMLFVQTVCQQQYLQGVHAVPFLTAAECPDVFSMLRGYILPAYVVSVASPTVVDLVIPALDRIGRVRLQLANVNRYMGDIKGALAHVRALLGVDPVMDSMRWVSVKLISQDAMPDVIGTIVTMQGVDLGRSLVEGGLMLKYDPARRDVPAEPAPVADAADAAEAPAEHEGLELAEPRASRHQERTGRGHASRENGGHAERAGHAGHGQRIGHYSRGESSGYRGRGRGDFDRRGVKRRRGADWGGERRAIHTTVSTTGGTPRRQSVEQEHYEHE